MFGKLFKRRGEDISAAKLYSACLAQSRTPAFYGPGKVTDNYDGRIDLLTLHLTAIMAAARQFGDEGAQLNQALYDVMIQDFNIAMREEGLADTGIARRIKPMVMLFLGRTKAYTEAFLGEADIGAVLKETLLPEDVGVGFSDSIAAYAAQSYETIKALDFDVLKSGQVSFAPFTGD